MSDNTSAPASAGALLRAAREKQGLHIAALAAAIKVTPRKLDALENDRWNELPDATFTRALAQTVCRSLKIEAKPVLDLLPPAEPVALEPSANALNEPFSERSNRDDAGWASAAIRPMVLAAVLLMLLAVVVYFLPDSLWSGGKPSLSSVPLPVTPAPASSGVVQHVESQPSAPPTPPAVSPAAAGAYATPTGGVGNGTQ